MRKSLALLTLLPLLAAAGAVQATGLLPAWQAAAENDRDHAVARAAHATAQPRRDQASALWRPGVAFTASAGLATGESEMRGAQFSAPGFGQATGVNFGTSVTGGTATRWALQARQPLYNPERRAQQQQLGLQADMAELQWQAAGQALMLRTAERYLGLAVAQESLRVLERQRDAVQQAAAEAQERFELGAAPITDTHEARARLAALRAQVVAAQVERDVQRRQLADSTGLPADGLQAYLPGAAQAGVARSQHALDWWQEQAASGNPGIRQQQLAADIARAEADKHRLGAAPTVDLVAQAGDERLHGSGAYGSARNKSVNALVGVQLTVPLYTGGWRAAKEDESLRLWEQAQAQVEATRAQVARQVHAAWLGLHQGAERVQALAEALQASEARLDATRTGLEVGHRTLLDLLNAENDTAATRLALAQARSSLLLERLRLAALAGQLDEDLLRTADQALEH